MQRYFLYLFLSSLLISCKEQSHLTKIYNCNNSYLTKLERVIDAKKQFEILLPKNWKINLYIDNQLSSIYAADTTLELSKTILLDVSFVQQNIHFNLDFKKKSYLTHYKNQLDETISKDIFILEKPAYITISKGKKGKLSYQISEMYIKLNDNSFILAKIEIYGDSLVENRFCKAFNLIDQIQLK